MTDPVPQSGPTALRITLGTHLRRMREEAGISRTEAGWEIRSSESKISRMELGRVGFKERDVRDLLKLYKVTDDQELTRLLTLAQDANTPGWWHRYGDVMPTWFQSYLGLEVAAELIRTYELQFVPGLLQTPDYARAVVQLGRDDVLSPQELERRVALRISRQEVLARERPVRLWAVLDEGVLRRPIGGVAVLRAQLQALIEAIKHPNITLQIMPFGSGGHPATGGAFTLLRFPDPDLPDVVYIEHLTSGLYLDKRQDLDEYAVTMDALSIAAPPPKQTELLLTETLMRLG